MSDVTTNEKLMNVGGLKHNGVIAHMLVPAKMVVSEFVFHAFEESFATSMQTVCFCRQLETEKHERIAGVSTNLPFRCTLYFVLSQRGCFKSDVYFCNAGKWCATAVITQIVSYPGSSLGSTKLDSRLRNEPLVCP